MALENEILPPPLRFALAYCPAGIRPGFALLLRFDERIAGIAMKQGEPMVAQLKLAWWREALTSDANKRPRGEPMLAELSRYEGEELWPGLAKAMGGVLDAWGLLLANETWSEEMLGSFAHERGAAVFGTYLSWLGASPRDGAGEGWALDDLAVRSGETLPKPEQIKKALPRSLSILAMAARQQRTPTRLSGPRLILHGLTGL